MTEGDPLLQVLSSEQFKFRSALKSSLKSKLFFRRLFIRLMLRVKKCKMRLFLSHWSVDLKRLYNVIESEHSLDLFLTTLNFRIPDPFTRLGRPNVNLSGCLWVDEWSGEEVWAAAVAHATAALQHRAPAWFEDVSLEREKHFSTWGLL